MPVRLTTNLAPSLASSRLTSGYQLAAVHARALSSYRPHPNTACAKHIFLRWPTIDSYASKRLFHASTPSFASAKDPYQVLGVGKNASAAEIKKVYFSLARKYHPDTNPDKSAREKFQEIQEAYDILKDDKKRADYDKYGAASQQQGFDADAYERMRQNPFNGAGFGGFGGFGGMGGGGFAGAQGSDLFESLFGGFAGGSGARARSQRGENLETVIGLSFMDACKGTSRTVNTTPVVDCDTCSGTGLKSGAKRSTCSGCGGSGTRTFVVDGGFQMASTCGQCGGSGTTIPRGSSCGTCNGVGKTRTRKSVEVDIPAGVEDGMVIRVPGAGDAPMSGSGRPGDLLVRISVAPSKQFRRQGPNLYHEARIPMHTAVLGGRVRIPTLDGNVDVRVPGGTQQGEEMVLKGRGVASRLGGYVDQGDLFVSFIVQLPRSLTARQRELLEKYADDVEGRTPAAGTNSSTQSSSSGDPVQTPSSSKNSDERKNPKVDENDDRLGTRSEGDAEGDEETPEQARKASA